MDAQSQQAVDDIIAGIVNRPSPLARFGQGVANILPETVQGVTALGQQILDPEVAARDRVKVPNFFDLPEAKSTSEKIADFGAGALNAVASFEGGSALLGKLGPIGRLAQGVGPLTKEAQLANMALQRAAGFGLGNALLTSQTNPEEAGTAFVTGAATGALHILPIEQRILPGAAIATGAIGVTGNPNEAINVGLMGLLGPQLGKSRLKPLSDAVNKAHEQTFTTSAHADADFATLQNTQPRPHTQAELIAQQQAAADAALVGSAPKPVVLAPERTGQRIQTQPSIPKINVGNPEINADLQAKLDIINGVNRPAVESVIPEPVATLQRPLTPAEQLMRQLEENPNPAKVKSPVEPSPFPMPEPQAPKQGPLTYPAGDAIEAQLEQARAARAGKEVERNVPAQAKVEVASPVKAKGKKVATLQNSLPSKSQPQVLSDAPKAQVGDLVRLKEDAGLGKADAKGRLPVAKILGFDKDGNAIVAAGMDAHNPKAALDNPYTVPHAVNPANIDSIHTPNYKPKLSVADEAAPRLLKATDVQAHLNKITANWKNKPEIEVVQSGPEGIEGMLYEGKATIYADQMRDLKHAETVLLHEVDGHHGMLAIMGAHYAPILDRVGKTIAPSRLQRIAEQYGYDLSNPHLRRRAIEEYIAVKAQNNSLSAKVVALVKDGLNKLGFKFSDDFVRQLIKDSRKYVRDGEVSLANQQAASLGLIHNGIQKGIEGKIEDHHIFTDPVSGTSFSHPVGGSTETLIQNLQDARRGFSREDFATLQNSPDGVQYSKRLAEEEGKLKSLAKDATPMLAGAATGAIASELSDNKMSLAEGIALGGLFGLFAPRVARSVLGESYTELPKDIANRMRGKNLGDIVKAVTDKKTWEELGLEGTTFGKQTPITHAVRWLEANFNLNAEDSLQAAKVISSGEGMTAIKSVEESLRRAKGIKPTDAMIVSANKFAAGEIPESQFRAEMGSSPEGTAYAENIVTAKTATNALQAMLISGLREGPFKNAIISSRARGDYMVAAYRMFNEKGYAPSPESVEKLLGELKQQNPDVANFINTQHLMSYHEQLGRDRLGFPSSSTKAGQVIDGLIFTSKKELSDAFKEYLGVIKDPRERYVLTLQKLLPASISAKLIESITNSVDRLGLKHSYDSASLQQAVEALKGKADPDSLQKIATLQSYLSLPEEAQYGKLGGTFVSRHVHDLMTTDSNVFGSMEGPIMQGMSRLHAHVKLNKTALNPLTQVGNIVTAPLIGWAGKADMEGWKLAYDLYKKGDKHPDFNIASRNEIYDANFVRGELMRDTDQLFREKNPNAVFDYLANLRDKTLEFYQAPDIITRAAVFFSARARYAKEFGLELNNQKVIDAARDWTNRYSPNYAHVAPFFKKFRKLPFANMYITFAAEMGRVSKNLIEDLVSSTAPVEQRIHAAKVLGSYVALPAIAEKVAESALSVKDKQDWQQFRDLSPAYARTRNLVPTGRDANGNFHYIDITKSSPIDSWVQTLRGLATGDLRAAAEVNPAFGLQNTPFLSWTASQVSGRDIHSKRNLNDIPSRITNTTREFMPPLFPGGSEYEHVANAFTKNDKGTWGLTNQKTGRVDSPAQVIETYLTGMRFNQGNLDVAKKQVINEAKSQIANERKYAMDTLNLRPNDQELVKRVTDRYAQAEKRILEDLALRLK